MVRTDLHNRLPWELLLHTVGCGNQGTLPAHASQRCCQRRQSTVDLAVNPESDGRNSKTGGRARGQARPAPETSWPQRLHHGPCNEEASSSPGSELSVGGGQARSAPPSLLPLLHHNLRYEPPRARLRPAPGPLHKLPSPPAATSRTKGLLYCLPKTQLHCHPSDWPSKVAPRPCPFALPWTHTTLQGRHTG